MSTMELDIDARTAGKVGVGFVAAAVLLYLFGRVLGWNEIISTLRGADLRWLAVACLSTSVCLVLWAKVWDVILGIVDVDIPYRSILPTYLAATFADYVTPFGKAGGNPFIAYILSRDNRASYQESLAGVVTADLLNLVPFFTFAGVGFVALLVRGSIPDRAEPLVAVLAVLAVGLPLAVYLSHRKRESVQRVAVAAVRPVAARTSRIDADSVRHRVAEFYDRVDRIAAHPRVLSESVALSFAGWIFFAAPLYLAGQTLGVAINPLLVLFVVPASTLAGFVPTPGGLGGVEVALVALLVALSPVSGATAAAIALVYRVASFWYVIVVGGVAAFYELYAH